MSRILDSIYYEDITNDIPDAKASVQSITKTEIKAVSVSETIVKIIKREEREKRNPRLDKPLRSARSDERDRSPHSNRTRERSRSPSKYGKEVYCNFCSSETCFNRKLHTCGWGSMCPKKTCPFYHPSTSYKYLPCVYYEKGRCFNGEKCTYAHGYKDAQCHRCNKVGHFTVDCPHKNSQR